MILAFFEDSFTRNNDTLLAERQATTRLALASSFVLASSTNQNHDALQAARISKILDRKRRAKDVVLEARKRDATGVLPSGGLLMETLPGPLSPACVVEFAGKNVNATLASSENRGSTDSFDSSGMTKAQCMALLHAMDTNLDSGQFFLWKMREFVFTHLDQDDSGRIEFIEFERLLLLCRCCHRLSRDRLLAHKATIARADLVKADAHAMLTYKLSKEQRHLVEETIVCHERVLARAHANIDTHLNHLNQSFRIFGCCESRWLDNISVFVDIMYFGATAMGATAWVGVGFNFVYCFEVIIRIHSMQSWALFCNDPRGREHALQNKVTLGCTAVGMFGAMLVVLQKCGVNTNQERLWEAIQLAPLLRIFVTSARFRHIVRACSTGLKRIRPFVTLFTIVFYAFSMLAYYAFKDLDIKAGDVFSEQLNFSTFGDSCLAMFQATSHILTCSD